MKTLNNQYRLIKEGKGHKDVFLKEAKAQFPNWIRNAATYNETTTILKQKGIINENVIGLEPINQLVTPPKENYEVAFSNFLEEAKKKQEDAIKAEEKETSKKVKEKQDKNFDRKNMEDPNNLIFDQVMKGYYAEMKNPKNCKKTMDELKKIVFKNLAKDPIYYTKNGQFGEDGVGYETEVPGLGTPKEPKGPYKSSGYGTLKESHQPGDKVIKSLKDGEGNITKQNYNQFKKGEYKPSLQESKLRKVINTLIREELEQSNESYGEDNNILYLNRVRDAIKSPNNTLDNSTKKLLLIAVNALDPQNIDLYSLIDSYDTDTLHTLEGVFKQVDDEFYSEFTDPTGGSGLESHLEESKFRKVVNTLVKQQIQENVQKELQQIDKEAKSEILASKLKKIEAAIDKRQSQLDRLDEDEDLKNLTDKKKLKAIAKDIKVLGKAKAKIEKELAKKDKSSKPQPEMIDEDGIIDEFQKSQADIDKLNQSAETSIELTDKLKTNIDTLEEDEDVGNEEEMTNIAKEAENMYEKFTELDGMDDMKALESVLIKFSENEDFVRNHLMSMYNLGPAGND